MSKPIDVQLVKQWILEAAELVKYKMFQPLTIETKTSDTDLVTNVDKEIERFLVSKIRQYYPRDTIVGEEHTATNITTNQNRVWYIDPIDGTLNFVKQRDNFCIMLALYENGEGICGFIYDVMNSELTWGGPNYGVYINERAVTQLPDMPLADGLIGMNHYLFAHNMYHAQDIGESTSGIRVMGCAGLEFISMLKGQTIGYITNISPWDYAAGKLMIETLGMKAVRLEDAKPLNFYGREPFIALCPTAYTQVINKYYR